MDEHNKYIKFIDGQLKKTIGAKVKSSDPVKGVVKILSHFFNQKGTVRNYIFMYPTRIQNPATKFKITGKDEPVDEGKVEITIRDILNDMSSCVIFDIIKHKGFFIINDSSSKFGECSPREPYAVPFKKSEMKDFESNIPPAIVTKIVNNVYSEFPLV
jgi:hypothetical protein